MSKTGFCFALGNSCDPSYPEDDGIQLAKPRSESQIITIAEYARLHNLNISTLRKHVRNKRYRTAHKISGYWYINKYDKIK